MSIKFTKLSSIFFLTTITSLLPLRVWAQTTTENEVNQVTLQQAFNDAFFENSGTAFRNDGFRDQLNNIFGFDRYPDIQISKDGELVHTIYEDALKQQGAYEAPMKTRDLSNPFTTSLQENPSYIGY